MQFISINENDIVEMKKPHPCEKRCKQFKIVRVGADVKIQCLACGHYDGSLFFQSKNKKSHTKSRKRLGKMKKTL